MKKIKIVEVIISQIGKTIRKQEIPIYLKIKLTIIINQTQQMIKQMIKIKITTSAKKNINLYHMVINILSKSRNQIK